jgi:hypothetical protein
VPGRWGADVLDRLVQIPERRGIVVAGL